MDEAFKQRDMECKEELEKMDQCGGMNCKREIKPISRGSVRGMKTWSRY